MEKIFITLLVALIGGLIGIKLKIPAGALIGAMVFVAIYNIYSSNGYIPKEFKLGAQIVVGGMIGLNFTKEIIWEMRKVIGPAILVLIGLTVVSIALGYLLHRFTGMDLTTALFSTSPGGLTDMTLLADAYGAETSTVVVIHTLRLVTVVTVIPLIIKYLTGILVKANI